MERVWASRLRWRVRGAWQWPAFGLFVVLDAVLLEQLPVAGAGPGGVAAVLLAGALNLALVALAAPLAGRIVRRRRPDLPQVVASDYAGTGLLAAFAVVLVALGVAHRPALRADRQAYAVGLHEVQAYVMRNAEPQYRQRLADMTTLRFGEDLYRACVPGDQPRRALCLFVMTDQDPPGIRVDPNRAPNTSYSPIAG